MGATPYSNEKKQYFNAHGFQFTTRTTEGSEGATKRTILKDGEEPRDVWEHLFKDLTGNIVSIELKQGKFGKQYEIIINDLLDTMILQLPAESGYADTLICRLPNIDPLQSVKLVPYSFIPEGKKKKKDGLNVFQNDVKILSAFTKENHNGAPQPEKPVMDEDEWKIYFMQLRKFYSKVVLSFNDKLKALKPETKNSYVPEQADDSFTPDNAADDLPF